MRGDIFRNHHKRFVDTVFSDFAQTIWVYLKSSNSKGATYDPYRDIGYTKTSQSPLPVNAYIRQLTSSSLIVRELGLTQSGAIEIVVKEQDMNLFKICDKVIYNSVEYSPFNNALGNRVQITEIPFKCYRIVLFRVGK